MIGNNSFNFEKETFGAFRLGLDEIDPSLRVDLRRDRLVQRRRRGDRGVQQPEATEGVGAIYPYLGGSHEAVVKLSNENDIITMSAGAAERLRAHRPRLRHRRPLRLRAATSIAIFDKILSGELPARRDRTCSMSASTTRSARSSATRRRSSRPRWTRPTPRSPPATWTSHSAEIKAAGVRGLSETCEGWRRRPPPHPTRRPRWCSTASPSATAGRRLQRCRPRAARRAHPRRARRERRRQVDADEDPHRADPARRRATITMHGERGAHRRSRWPRPTSASRWCTSTTASSSR